VAATTIAIPQELKDLAAEIRESHHLKAVDIHPFNGRFEFYWKDYRGNYNYYVADSVDAGVLRIPMRRDPAAKTRARKRKSKESESDEGSAHPTGQVQQRRA
jgi:hypothetical protein